MLTVPPRGASEHDSCPQTTHCVAAGLPACCENLRDDVLNRTETAMTQAHCFLAMELAIAAHAQAEPLAGSRPA